MGGVTVIMLLAFVMLVSANHTAIVQGFMDELIDKTSDQLFDSWSYWGLKVSPLSHADMDGTTIAGTSHLSIRPRLGLRPLLPYRTYPASTLVESTSSSASHQPRTPINPNTPHESHQIMSRNQLPVTGMESLKADLLEIVSDSESPNWDIFAPGFKVIDQSGNKVEGLGPLPIDMKMLKFLRMVRRLGPVPIDIQVHFGNRQVAHEPSDAFLVARWTVKLGGMKLPFSSKVLQDRRVEIEAETVFHVSENKIDYMRIDRLLVNGKNYAQENEEQFAHEGEASALVPAVFLITPKPEVDIYRDTILRYAGYLNEIGEAFRPIIPGNVVLLSYALAITYVLADGFDKGTRVAGLDRNKDIKGCGLAAVIDTLTFQFVASIIIPGTLINRWVALNTYLVQKQFDVANVLSQTYGVDENTALASLGGIDVTPHNIAEKIPTALGLALIPLIVAPIDGFTEQFLDAVVRPALEKAFPQCYLPFCDSRDECEIE